MSHRLEFLNHINFSVPKVFFFFFFFSVVNNTDLDKDAIFCCIVSGYTLSVCVDEESALMPRRIHTKPSSSTIYILFMYSKTCVKRPLLRRQKIGFQDQFSRPIIANNAGQTYCRMQYFRPLSIYHLSLRSLFCLFLSGCFTQVLL